MMRTLLPVAMTLALGACGGGGGGDATPVPRPRAYARMELPAAVYAAVDSVPVHIERNAATGVSVRDERGITMVDISYQGLGATLYVTVTPVTAATVGGVLANRSERMALNAGDNTTEIIDLTGPEGDAQVTVTPTGSPTPVQFLALRGDAVVSGQAFVDAAATVRTDSLRPLVDMLRRDVLHMVERLR